MPNFWTLGGLSLRELLRRTLSESWHDAVFGQAGRMAFYHFLAMFPALLVLLTVAARATPIEPQLKSAIAGLAQQFLPAQASSLLHEMVAELANHEPAGLRLWTAFAGACWAALNGTWALIFGLNKAYEVEENRPKWKLGVTVAGLMVWLALSGICALLLLSFAQRIEVKALRGLEWLIMVVLLMLSFAVVYRFAPDLRDHEWSWSTPGAVCALLLSGEDKRNIFRPN